MSRTWILIGSVFLVLVVGFLDYATGFEISFSVFYLIPVSLAAWVSGRWAGFGISVFSAFVWLYANKIAGETYSNGLVPYWNGLTRLLFFLVVSSLLAELRQILENERKLARTDLLTGAYNRRVFYDVLAVELIRSERYGRSFTLLYIDLDNFKKVNDEFGHQTGDEVLKSLTETVAKNIRVTDVFCRLGGDEFAMLMPETDLEASQTIVPRLQATLMGLMEGKNWPVTFSIGALTCTKPHQSSEQLIAKADQLMYQVKQSTKNGIRFASFSE